MYAYYVTGINILLVRVEFQDEVLHLHEPEIYYTFDSEEVTVL